VDDGVSLRQVQADAAGFAAGAGLWRWRQHELPRGEGV